LALLSLYYFLVTAYQLATSTWPAQATVRAEGRRSIVIGSAAAPAEAGAEATGQVEVSVAPAQSGWSLP